MESCECSAIFSAFLWKGTIFMTTAEVIEKIREGLTGEYSVDMVYLEAEADRYRPMKNGREIENAIADLAFEIMPEDKRALLNKMMYLDGKRLDTVFAEAQKLANEKKDGRVVSLDGGVVYQNPYELSRNGI